MQWLIREFAAIVALMFTSRYQGILDKINVILQNETSMPFGAERLERLTRKTFSCVCIVQKPWLDDEPCFRGAMYIGFRLFFLLFCPIKCYGM